MMFVHRLRMNGFQFVKGDLQYLKEPTVLRAGDGNLELVWLVPQVFLDRGYKLPELDPEAESWAQ